MPSPSRRQVLKMLGGSLAGIFLTPIPWKLLDDTSIMTQTGPWITKLPRGPRGIKYSTCTLCPAGCGVRARTIGGVPFGLSGIPNHPLSLGTLCAAGLAAHHSSYHPLRVRTTLAISHGEPASSVLPISREEADARLQAALKGRGGEGIAILDLHPGRNASLAYRRILNAGAVGQYIVPALDGAMILDAMCEAPYGPTGLDIGHAKLVVSLGAPLLESGGSTQLLLNAPVATRPKIIQLETRRSRSAVLADEWIPINPGSETALALGLAREIMCGRSYDAAALHKIAGELGEYNQLVSQFTPELVSELTGIKAQRLISLAQELVHESPAIIVHGSALGPAVSDREAEMAVMGLNLILGNLGKEGGLVARSEIPAPNGYSESELAPVVALNEVPDHSIRLLLIEDPGTALPIAWESIERKLSGDHPFIVAFSPYLTGVSRRADLFFPTPAPFEVLTDIPTPPIAVTASFAVAAPLRSSPEGVVDPVEILSKLFSSSGTSEQLLRERVEAIRKQGRGTLFSYKDGSYREVKSFDSSDNFWNAFVGGAVWLDNVESARQIPMVSFFGKGGEGVQKMRESALKPERFTAAKEERFPLVLFPFTYIHGGGVAQVSPLMSKVYQESGLRFTSDIALVEPATASGAGVEDGDVAYVETARGSHKMRITLDTSVLPGIILASVGPDPVSVTAEGLEVSQNSLSLVAIDTDGTWQPTPATIRKAS